MFSYKRFFMRNVHVSFFTLRTCVVCVMGVTPLKKILDLWIPAAAFQACNFRTLSLLLGDPETLRYSVFANLENRLTGERNNN